MEDARTGSFVWIEDRHSSLRVLFSTNAWLRKIAAGRAVEFSYKSLDAENLRGWILLPPTYRPGHRYPAVVWVYAGTVMDDTPPLDTRLNLVFTFNMQLLAAHGYAVIFPSMPLPPFGHPNDPYTKLSVGVFPAIDKAATLGYIDANRVGVAGLSYGGYSTYGLITQTDRFKAAVAVAGASDLASLYGGCDVRLRYNSSEQDTCHGGDYFNMQWAEDFQGNLGAPPWVNPERYARNSPITYVERIHTPLLIAQGDMDFVAIQQGEEFFNALYRQGKRAEFVRYWGEGHVFRSEANVADLWRRMCAWFDEYLR